MALPVAKRDAASDDEAEVNDVADETEDFSDADSLIEEAESDSIPKEAPQVSRRCRGW